MHSKVNRLLLWVVICLVVGLASVKHTIVINAAASDVTVNLAKNNQIIRGFGACSAWRGALSDANMNVLFTDMGLSILRVRIDYNKSWSDELSNAKKAAARGATIIASPWTPPVSMKTNNNAVDGELKTSEYANYAKYLKSFADYFTENGISLYAISIQNEPNISVTYESCRWSATQMRDFLKNNGPAIGSTKIIMPEAYNFDFSMSDPTLNDTTACSYVSIIGGHLYGATIRDYPLARSKGKEVWMTEYCYQNVAASYSQSLSEALNTAKQIHDCMATGNMNAYIWWFVTGSDVNGLINTASVPQKRGYVIGQYSKFVRPGYYRVDATSNPTTNVYVTAYKSDNKVVIVAINNGGSAVTQKFSLQNGTTSKMSSWYTNAGSNIAAGSSLPVSDGSFTANLPAQSVTTFIGDLETTTPSSSPSPSLNPSLSPSPSPTPSPTVTPSLNPTPSATATDACAVTYSMNDWGSGATVSITIKNNSATSINGWTLAWQFAGNQKITNIWNASFAQSGTAVTANSETYNATIPAGGTTSFGFNLSYSGSNPKPTGFTLNGTACTVN